MKQIIQGILSLTIFLMIVFVSFFISVAHAGNSAGIVSVQNKKGILENKIPGIAERYIGVPYFYFVTLQPEVLIDICY